MNTTLKCKSCTPHAKTTSPLSVDAENDLLSQLSSWTISRSDVHRIIKRFDFNSFLEAIGFFNTIALVAEEQKHYPLLSVDYRTVSIELTTNSILGLSENDFIMAAKIDGIYAIVTEPVIGVLESAML